MRLEVESEAEDVGESLTGLLTEPGGAHGARSPEHCAKPGNLRWWILLLV